MSPNRKVLETFGKKRKLDYVRVLREVANGRPLVRVQWREGRRIRTESFDDTRKGIAEAKAFAEGKHDALGHPAPTVFAPIGLKALHLAYLTAKVDDWRPRTFTLHNQRWGKFELFAGKDTPAHLVTRERIDEFKRALFTNKHAPNQVRRIIDTVTVVFRWAVERDLIAPNKVGTYALEIGRDAKLQAPKMEEFRAVDRDRVLERLDPRNTHHWRAWVMTTLLAYCGPRIKAALHLEWRDVDFESGRIHWRPELDKMAGDRRQPMPHAVRDALRVAYGWRTAGRYDGPFIFAPAREKTRTTGRPWGYQAYVRALHEAEKRAGLTPTKYKAAHAFRRGVAGDLVDLTGSEKAAAEWIGDRDVRVVKKHYLKDRDDRLQNLAELLSGTRSGSERSATNRNGTQRTTDAGQMSQLQDGDSQPLTSEPQVGIEPTTARSTSEAS